MKVRNFGDEGPYRDAYRNAWDWIVAIDAYDFGDPNPLDELLSTEPLPEELISVIESISSGERKPNLKAAAKLKIPAAERLQIAGAVSVVLLLIDVLKRDVIDPAISDEAGVKMLGESKGREPVEILRELEAEARKAIELAAHEAGVSVETIENLLRHLRQKMEQYPNV